jgi:serine phosphatase RsbU (regulator of sigma subunit)
MPTDPIKMQCLQVWGGNRAATQTLHMTGLDLYLVARPFEDQDAGGDVYYASSCASGRISRVILADVAGHGDQVASFADGLRKLMQRYVNYTSHQRFVARLNRAFGEATDDGRFATAVALSYFAPKRELNLINAGHPPPLHYDAEQHRWSALENTDEQDTPRGAELPLGIDGSIGYEQTRKAMRPGDLLLMYTDAFIEAMGPDGRQIGVQGLLETVREVCARAGETPNPERVLPDLLAYLAPDHDGTASLGGDDTTALLLRATGIKRQWPKVLTSPFHLLRGMARGQLATLTH